MPQVELIMPKMGESVFEATIIKWLKNEGDKIALDEPVLEIATDKVDSEIPSTAEGILVKKLYKEGEVVQVGKPIALISVGAEAATAAPIAPKKITDEIKPDSKGVDIHKPIAVPSSSSNGGHISAPVFESVSVERTSSSGKFFSPLVRNIARAEGISIDEIESISGTGKDGRVPKHDIISFLPNRKTGIQAVSPLSSGRGAGGEVATPVFVSGNDEIIEMDRMRKLIAEHMVMSKRVSPHVTSYVEADVTNIVKWRDKI